MFLRSATCERETALPSDPPETRRFQFGDGHWAKFAKQVKYVASIFLLMDLFAFAVQWSL